MVESKTENMNSGFRSLSQWRNHMLLLVAVMLPFFPKFLTVPLLINLLLWFIDKNEPRVTGKLTQNKPALYLVIFYVLHILGLLWTSNFGFAGLDLQIKLPLLIFPLVLATTNWPDEELKTKMFRYFLVSMVPAVIICVLRALYSYFTHGPNYFFYKEFSYFLHPGYFSMFLCFGTVLLLNDLCFGNLSKRFIKNEIYIWLMLFLFTFAIVLLASKAGIFVQIALLLAGLVMLVKKDGFNSLKRLSGVALLFAALIYFGLFSPLTAGRMNELKTTVSATQTQEVHSSGERLQAWQSALQLIKQYPIIGTGTGDVKDELVKRYEVNGFDEIFRLRLNAHNQFLQSFVALGITGFILLILIFYHSLVISIKTRDFILAGFIFISLFNMMIEAVIEVTAGSVFFGLFLTLLVNNNSRYNLSSNGSD